MNIDRKHIVFRILTICLVSTLLFPAAFKLAHVFEHHKHEVCIGGDATHIHQVDLDCEFHKFQITHHFLISADTCPSYLTDFLYKISFLTYKFLNNHRPLSFSLRGPPVLV